MGRQSATQTMTPSPPPSPSQTAAYATNGLEILQAASDAAHALHDAVAEQQPAPPLPPPPAVTPAAAPAAVPALHGAAAVAGRGLQHQHQHQHNHHIHQHPQHPQPPPPPQRDPSVNPKLTRLRRACDMCSMRKVKCDDSEVPCRPCRELGVDCTYQRETKRRGPPNKHAEAAKAAKRARVDLGTVASAALPASPSPRSAARALVDISADGALDAEAIGPLPVLELLVDDFFTYLHPLAPLPHEPTFRQSFANREDRSRPEFLALFAGMVAALVASFPRCAREHLKAHHGPHLFPKPVVLADRCRDIALLARGSRWLLKQPKTLDDAAASYFLGLACAYTHQVNASRHFMAETLTLVRELGFAPPKHPGHLPTFGNDPYSEDLLPFNHVKDQIGKRLFWCLLLAVR